MTQRDQSFKQRRIPFDEWMDKVTKHPDSRMPTPWEIWQAAQAAQPAHLSPGVTVKVRGTNQEIPVTGVYDNVVFVHLEQPAQVPDTSAKTWCEYVAGMVGCYLGEPVDSDKCKAIAGIIERRLWALPVAQPSQAPEHHEDNATVIKRFGQLIAAAERAGLVVTLERRPLQPLAMGHAEYVFETRPVRGKP